jgi:phenylpropionate dioxygenase-like ring-hydroxylating dioxygenase large terminal subunit
VSPDRWCPAATSRAVARGPVHVNLPDEELVVFRTASGTPAALQAQCPHRGLPLADGVVRGETITCSYHGWSFDRHGHGRNAAGQDRGMCAASYDAHEAWGLIWVRSPGGPGGFRPGLPLVGPVVAWVFRRIASGFERKRTSRP